jgi:hypothetical protein
MARGANHANYVLLRLSDSDSVGIYRWQWTRGLFMGTTKKRIGAVAACAVTVMASLTMAAGPVQARKCSKHYSKWACVPAHRADVDCTEISATDFRVHGRDIYGLDGDNDGIACES